MIGEKKKRNRKKKRNKDEVIKNNLKSPRKIKSIDTDKDICHRWDALIDMKLKKRKSWETSK